MKYLLSREGVDLLAQLSWSRLLLAFDFDGTLSPIVADRGQAKMRPRTSGLFGRACRLYPCAVISGRSRADVLARLRGALPDAVVGNHGLEPSVKMRSFEADVEALRKSLERALAGEPGVDIEDKRYSLAVHYRRSRRKQQARTKIARVVGRHSTAMRMVPGKAVMNVLPAGAPHKGDALRHLRKTLGADTALYVGDDVTDEDVFALDEPGRLVSVRIGRSPRSAAAYYLRDQREIDALLQVLVNLRKEAARDEQTARAPSR